MLLTVCRYIVKRYNITQTIKPFCFESDSIEIRNKNNHVELFEKKPKTVWSKNLFTIHLGSPCIEKYTSVFFSFCDVWHLSIRM